MVSVLSQPAASNPQCWMMKMIIVSRFHCSSCSKRTPSIFRPISRAHSWSLEKPSRPLSVIRKCLSTLVDQVQDADEDFQRPSQCRGEEFSVARLIDREFAELNIKSIACRVGGIRTRQHTNPLKASLVAPVPPPEWEDVFLDPSLPLMVDVGCGSGRFLMMLAKKNLESRNFLGLDIRHQIISRAKLWAVELGLKNLAFLVTNATVSFGSILYNYPGPLTYVTILCPDPQFKTRHHKRRIVQKSLVDALVKALAPGGKVLLQSDVKEVAVDMKCQFDTEEGVSLIREVQVKPSANDDDGWLLENPLGVRSEREIHALSSGRKVYRLLYRRL